MALPTRAWFIFWILIWVSGCSSEPDVVLIPETTLTLTIAAGVDINPSQLGTAAPLQLRLYELQNPGLFEKSDFLDIYLQDSAVLQTSLIKKHMLPTAQPGTTTEVSFSLDKTTRYIALFAEFANYKTATPSAIYRIATQANNLITLHISSNHLRLSGSQLSVPQRIPTSTDQEPEHGS